MAAVHQVSRGAPEDDETHVSVREYYEHNNRLVEHYIYIDKLLDSTLPRDLLKTYHDDHEDLPSVDENQPLNRPFFYGNRHGSEDSLLDALNAVTVPPPQRKRPSAIYKVADEESPLLPYGGGDGGTPEDKARIVTIAIWINFIANGILLVAKLMVALLTNSLSVLASLVDGILDFLSTIIVATTTRLVERSDQHAYPIGRARLEPLGILVFAVIMITSFVQVGLEAIQRLLGPSHVVIRLTPVAIGIMASTVVIKGACWLWCRLIKNSSVQALAEDAITDVIFNFFSVIFPLVGAFTDTWWLDPLGGFVLSLYVVFQWSRISHGHIKNLTGAAASPEQRNVILYLVMRFAKSIKQITSVQAYHAGDKLNVEVDLVLDNAIELKDSHDLGESLTYVLESLSIVDRAFVHLDYDSRNPPGHLR
ncbi:hypothetical protein EX30DRAFT_342404 [Ascodesmis nigricans]|uniref:Cation efflux protein transmembrane domain-containing protein n=1 Tax=Ascodesmis nigricans TaxID=341454 RepID=A0A4V3SIA2_9PEZI|nr:hypothetical protein EX30DRAFT_342404 [Ascodesmis nigricans]